MRFAKVIRAKSVILNGVELFLAACESCGEETYREKHERLCEGCRKKKQKKRA
jgi:Zn finger protein HypA/HybF involved in hydrogenase expression